jgi:hypothetical protein
MLTVGVFAFVILGLVNTAVSTAMKMQVNERVPKDERLSWWVHNFSELDHRHRELFPGSQLANIAQYSGWACIFLFAAMILSAFFQS